jgi:DNA-binding PadR family transcriptional regulator
LAGSETHGYDLYDRLERVIGDLVYVDSGTMYRMLRAMEQEGMVTSSWQPAEVGPSRRVYVATDGGFAELQAMDDALATRASAMQDLAAKATQIAIDSRRSSD